MKSQRTAPRKVNSEVRIFSDQSCKSGRVRIKLVEIFRADFGHAYKFFSQQRTLLTPDTVDAIELSKSSIKNG